MEAAAAFSDRGGSRFAFVSQHSPDNPEPGHEAQGESCGCLSRSLVYIHHKSEAFWVSSRSLMTWVNERGGLCLWRLKWLIRAWSLHLKCLLVVLIEFKPIMSYVAICNFIMSSLDLGKGTLISVAHWRAAVINWRRCKALILSCFSPPQRSPFFSGAESESLLLQFVLKGMKGRAMQIWIMPSPHSLMKWMYLDLCKSIISKYLIYVVDLGYKEER